MPSQKRPQSHSSLIAHVELGPFVDNIFLHNEETLEALVYRLLLFPAILQLIQSTEHVICLIPHAVNQCVHLVLICVPGIQISCQTEPLEPPYPFGPLRGLEKSKDSNGWILNVALSAALTLLALALSASLRAAALLRLLPQP